MLDEMDFSVGPSALPPRELTVSCNIVKDQETGKPLIALTLGERDEEPKGFSLAPGTVQNLGVLLISAAANAHFFGKTNEYMARLAKKGWDADLEAMHRFIEWMGQSDYDEI